MNNHKHLQDAKDAWDELGNINVDINDNIESSWRHFPEGTYYIELWRYIEDEYNVSVEEVRRL